MPKDARKLTRAEYEARIELLTDRLAVTLTLLKVRHGDDQWSPWIMEEMWEGEDGIAEEIRGWPDYRVAEKLVELFIKRNEK